MNIKELVKMIEKATGDKVARWQLERIYTAFNSNEEVIATYNTRTGKLIINN